MMSQLPVYMDGPAALLAQADKLGLTDEQKTSLHRILANARKEAVALLTTEQSAKLGDVPDKPVMGYQGDTQMACGAGCTKPCCAPKDDAVEQTVCPVMDAPINKNLYVEYEGKKVYFCCPGCKAKFEADPQRYLGKLPQFMK